MLLDHALAQTNKGRNPPHPARFEESG